MTSIVKANPEDFRILADLGKTTFRESHGRSASADDINKYVAEKYSVTALEDELNGANNIYRLIYHNQQPAGYSKIILNASHPAVPLENVTKLERLYLLKEFYDLKLGWELLKYNIELSQKIEQAGMWLFVWKENQRAVDFYTRAGFSIIGSYDFKLTESHSNPNHQMLLRY